MRQMMMATVLFLSLPGGLFGQPEGPGVRRAREVVAVINASSPAVVRAYVDTAFGQPMRGMPLDAHLGFFMGQWERSRGLDWVEATESPANGVTAVVTRRLTGDRAAIAVRTDPTAPYLIVGIGLRPPPPAAGGSVVRISSDQEMVTVLEKFVATLAREDVFSGAVLLAKDGRVLFTKAYGIANRDFDAPNRVDTKFNLGSMNKMFTSVAILQLAERGKLTLDDPLAKFVPDFPNRAAATKIRIKHLLSHTAGLGSYFNEEFDRSSRARFRTVDEMMRLAKGDSLAFEPGTRWSYSNTGMLVLGKVIEVASGQDYFSYIRDNIYQPAGMTNSDSYQLDYVNPNLAVGYEKEFADDGTKRYRNNIFMHVIRGGPAGGGYSTVEDLQRFAEALKDGKLVSKASVETLTTAKPELNSPRYGYGFGAEPGSEIVGHSGGFSGISANLDIFKKSGYVAVVQSNYGGGSAPVVEKIRGLVTARASSLNP